MVREDVILITVDCWRHDALAEMPRLEDVTSDWESGSVICAAPHTGGAFPAIFCSTYAPELYEEGKTIRDDATSLPQLLGDHGYSTAGFVASNPMVGQWADHFDYFWNAGLATEDSGGRTDRGARSTVEKAIDFLTLKPHTPAEHVLHGADKWWSAQSGPKFLWVDLMEPHSPYLPGFRRGMRAGPLRTYASLLAGAKHPDSFNYHGELPEWIQRHLRTLYDECVRELDSTLAEWIAKREEDATVLMTGDHGEEFDHGLITHARLYDETVKVPLLANRELGSLTAGDSTRQLDVSPALADALGIARPEEWEGEPAEDAMSPQPMIGSLGQYDQLWLGLRSERWKCVKNYDRETGLKSTEVYDLATDPDEAEPLPESEFPAELAETLRTFIDRPSIQAELSQSSDSEREVDPMVEDRLRELGYTE